MPTGTTRTSNHKTLKTRHSSNTKVCHGINRSFRNGRTRTHPLAPKQEALLTRQQQEANLCRILADAVKRSSPCSHGYLVRGASYARHLFDVTVATGTEAATVGAGVAVHLPVNLHGFSVREEEDREEISTQTTKPMRSAGRTRVHAVASAGKEKGKCEVMCGKGI